MTKTILMPALSPTMTEGNLAKWLVKEGDTVNPGDVIAEIETDKATMEVEAVDEGVLGRIVVAEGAEGVQVNAIIGVILEDGEDASALEGAATAGQGASPAPASTEPATPPITEAAAPVAAPAASGDIPASPLARRVAAQTGVDLSAISGTGAGGKIMMRDLGPAAGGATAAPTIAPTTAVAPAGERQRLFASPLARRMAAQAGLDLSVISGSGPEGRIVKADIDAAIAGGTAAPAAAPATIVPLHAPAGDGERSTVVRMSTMRKIIAERMSASKREVPHFYMTVDCEIDELLKVRGELNRRAAPAKISVNDFVIRACALALREVPAANVSWEGEGAIRKYNVVDVAVAVATDGGLITPIVRDADRKGLLEIAGEMQDLAARARDGKLMPEEYQGGSFSISNLGMYGVKQFDAVINPPQACILGVGAGEKRPVVRDDAIVPATVMSCTLSVDHRTVDGAIGAELLAAIKRLLEYPPAMLL